MTTPKLKGAAHELLFAAECVARGGTVSFTFGEEAPYDFILDNGGRLIKMQLKKAHYRPGQKRWVANSQRRSRVDHPTTSVAVPYVRGAVDCIATLAGQHWYFFIDVHLLPTCVGMYPDRASCPYAELRDRWALIGLPNQPLTSA